MDLDIKLIIGGVSLIALLAGGWYVKHTITENADLKAKNIQLLADYNMLKADADLKAALSAAEHAQAIERERKKTQIEKDIAHSADGPVAGVWIDGINSLYGPAAKGAAKAP